MIKQNDVGNLKLTNFTIDFTGLYAQLIICPIQMFTEHNLVERSHGFRVRCVERVIDLPHFTVKPHAESRRPLRLYLKHKNCGTVLVQIVQVPTREAPNSIATVRIGQDERLILLFPGPRATNWTKSATVPPDHETSFYAHYTDGAHPATVADMIIP